MNTSYEDEATEKEVGIFSDEIKNYPEKKQSMKSTYKAIIIKWLEFQIEVKRNKKWTDLYAKYGGDW